MGLPAVSRRQYSDGATPIEHLPRLSKLLGGPQIYIKRDDQLGLAAGGNKTRKLEYLVADALASGADTLITTGAVQSNHCRLTLAAAIREGLRCRLVLEERVPGSYDPAASGNNLLITLMRPDEVSIVPGGSDIDSALRQAAQEAEAEGGTPYVIPGGGSTPLGAMGYVTCAAEILEQCRARDLDLDQVICPSGSGGTQAGLVAGFAGRDQHTPVVGISVRADRARQVAKVHALAQGALDLIGVENAVRDGAVVVRDEYVGAGYSLPSDDMVEAVHLLARTEGILLDPVYTGKAAAGMIAMIRNKEFAANQNLLFLHTGGLPGLYAYGDQVMNLPRG